MGCRESVHEDHPGGGQGVIALYCGEGDEVNIETYLTTVIWFL